MPSGFFALLDDLALIMDDVAAMTKVAGKKTAGILGDDLAVNAEKAVGFPASRELPVLWAITKGSFLNKLIILPLAFLLSAFASWLIQPILIAGGVYLAYEGVEKVVHTLRPHGGHGSGPAERPDEKTRIRSAVLVDFILSVEIIIIALSQVVESDLIVQVLVVSIIALVATVGVYGLVALIVRMDDAGMALMERDEAWARSLGKNMVLALPKLIRVISHVGTVALLLVAGGIFHHIDAVHHLFHGWPGLVVDGLLGALVGSAALVLKRAGLKIRSAVSR
ncbi:MAG: DUF808 domain-containing protein [Flavobacteriales bacterium]